MLTETFDVEVPKRAKHDELVNAFMAKRSVGIAAILEALPRDDLKDICDAHGLDRSGRAKAPIVARILDGQGDPEAATEESKPVVQTSKKKAAKKEASRSKKSANKSSGNGVLGFEAQLFGMADQLWTNSGLQPSEYSTPVLALVFLKYADHKFAQIEAELAARQRRRRKASKDDYLARGVLYVPEEARFQRLVEMPEGSDLGKAVNDAMKAIERENPELKDVLPKTFAKFERTTLANLLKIFGSIPPESSGDTFGRIYEYFLGNFAPRTLQKGGEYFTPESVVKLIVEIVEPFHGRILDPACGSGGMFIQSARFVKEQKKNPSEEISIHGIEKISQTLRLAKMNLAVHGLSGDIREANTYYEDPHGCFDKFDFVMANPPFNQSAVDKGRIKDDTRRFPLGMPTPDNANYLWIQLFYSALNSTGRAGFVMANSASDARGSEAKIRQALVESGAVDVVVNLSSNLFYTVALPATLWFLDRGKTQSHLADRVLFIDARSIYRQVDRAHREMTPDQVEFLANIVRLHRGNPCKDRHGGLRLVTDRLGDSGYADIAGLCYSASRDDVARHDWSLNPGRYVGTDLEIDDHGDFDGRFAALVGELASLTVRARRLEHSIFQTAKDLSKEPA